MPSRATGINFEPSDEFDLIRSQLDRFIEQEVEPLEAEYDHFLGEDGHANRCDDDGHITDEFLALRSEIRQKSAEEGYMTMHMPEKVGGSGVDILDYLMLVEHLHNRHPDGFHEMVISDGPSGTQGPTPALLPAHEDEYQRENYFEPMMAATKEHAFALTEPEHGSDITWMDSTARKDGDDWLINGTKCFISNADVADFFVVHARTSGEDGNARGISSFFVDADNPGLEVGRPQMYMGNRVSEQAFVHLDDCRVPERNLIGDEDEGFIQTAIEYVGTSRLVIPAFATGRATWMFEQCTDYAADRISFGEPIGKRQFVQGMLADLRADIEQVRWLYRHAAWLRDRGECPRWEESAAKLRGSQLWNRASDIAIQIHGGAGLMGSLPFEREYRNARGTRIYDGTNQIHRRNMARDFLSFD